MDYFFSCIYSPSDQAQVGIFYLFWMGAFVGVNVLWDIKSKNTNKFEVRRLKEKTPVTYAAATFSSSLIILLSIPQENVATAVGEAIAPLVLVGIIGLLHGVGEICPYEIDNKSD